MRNWLRDWRIRQVFIRRDLKKTHLFRLWGHKLFADVLWKTDKRAIAGGLSLGLFVAFMPTIGFQMVIVTFGAIYFKVNLPVALAACWVTNPFTALPVYTAAWRLGRYILGDFAPIKEAFDLYYVEGKAVMFILHGLYLWTGSLIFSMASAISANIMVRGLWGLAHKMLSRFHKSDI